MVKSIRHYWPVLLLPAVVIVFSFQLRSAVGPFWQYADASYIYLLNSVNLVKGLPSAFFDQPGVPLQTLGQVIILILNIGHSTTDTVNRVLINPEFYVDAINITLLLLIPLTSVFLGAYTYRKTNDIIAVLLSQLPNVFLLTLRSSPHNHPLIYATVNAEPLLLVVSNLFNLFLLIHFYSQSAKKENLTMLAIGFICGLGIATKLNFIPLLILPFIIARWPMKPVFIIITVLSFVLWTLPIISLYPKLLGWTIKLLTHSGTYGNGHPEIIDIDQYFSTWKYVIHKFWFFILFPLCTLIISSIQLIKKQNNRTNFYVWAVSFAILVQLVIINKHFDEHYLVIVINCFGPLFVLFYINQISKNIFLKSFIVMLIVAATVGSCVITSTYAAGLADLTKGVVSFNDMIHAKYPNFIYIGSYLESPIRNSEYALFMGNDSSGGGEKEELSKLYPNNYVLFTESRDISGTCTYGIYHFNQPVLADDLIAQYPYILFINSGYDFDDSPYMVKPLEEGKYSKAYLLVGSTEKEANALFAMAVQSAQKGEYQKAFDLAYRSWQLHYQPRNKVEYFLSLIYAQIKHKNI